MNALDYLPAEILDAMQRHGIEPSGSCHDSQRLILATEELSPRLTYWEGVVISRLAGIARPHSWLRLDEKTIVDLAMRPGWDLEYRGYQVYRHELAEVTTARESLGFFHEKSVRALHKKAGLPSTNAGVRRAGFTLISGGTASPAKP